MKALALCAHLVYLKSETTLWNVSVHKMRFDSRWGDCNAHRTFYSFCFFHSFSFHLCDGKNV